MDVNNDVQISIGALTQWIDVLLSAFVNATVVAPIGGMTITRPAGLMHAKKFEKFDGSNFKRWQQNMKFYLTTRFLTKELYNQEEMIKGYSLLSKRGIIQITYVDII